MEVCKDELVLIRAITWLSEDAEGGVLEAQEIIEGLKRIIEEKYSIPKVMEIGQELKEKRKELSLSLKFVEKETGIPRGTISKIENGISKNPYYFTVKTLFDYYSKKKC